MPRSLVALTSCIGSLPSGGLVHAASATAATTWGVPMACEAAASCRGWKRVFIRRDRSLKPSDSLPRVPFETKRGPCLEFSSSLRAVFRGLALQSNRHEFLSKRSAGHVWNLARPEVLAVALQFIGHAFLSKRSAVHVWNLVIRGSLRRVWGLYGLQIHGAKALGKERP